jgi:predicted glycosyltransferase
MSLRVAFYSHNGFGLGHVSRNLKIAEGLLKKRPGTDVLIITGSAGLQSVPLPENVDYVKLPSVQKQATGRWRPLTLDIDMERLLGLRREMILQSIQAYRPHLFVADFLPLGVDGELLPTLEELSALDDAHSVIGFRDVLDDPVSVQRVWEADGTKEALRDLYDRVLVYGDADWFDFSPYGLDRELPVYVGLLGEPDASHSPPTNGDIRLIATCGGGVDGYDVLAAALDIAEPIREQLQRPVTCTAVTGPLMSDIDVQRLREIAKRSGGRVRRSIDNFPGKLARSSAVIGMAGYNTVCEVLSHRLPAAFVPRAGPSSEQIIRAGIMADRGLAKMIPLSETTPQNLATEVAGLLDGFSYPEENLPELGGIEKSVDALLELVD